VGNSLGGIKCFRKVLHAEESVMNKNFQNINHKINSQALSKSRKPNSKGINQ
jgi:hypothetical protein